MTNNVCLDLYSMHVHIRGVIGNQISNLQCSGEGDVSDGFWSLLVLMGGILMLHPHETIRRRNYTGLICGD